MSHVPGAADGPTLTATVVLVGLTKIDQKFVQQLFERSSRPALSDCTWTIQSRASVQTTLTALRQGSIQVVLCDQDMMPDAWKELLEQFACLSEPPCLIVTSRLADDRLWAEALNLGAYDVLARPFDRAEVLRTVSLARQHWQNGVAAKPKVMRSVA